MIHQAPGPDQHLADGRLHRLARIVALIRDEPMTARLLAKRLGVCRRTVLRDIRALRRLRVPVRSDKRKGYRIDGPTGSLLAGIGSPEPPEGLSLEELAGLALLAADSAELGCGLRAYGRQAVARMIASLSPPRRRECEHLIARAIAREGC